MKEVKSPKKPLIYYYGIVLLVLLLFNLIVSPLAMFLYDKETITGDEFMEILNKEDGAKHE